MDEELNRLEKEFLILGNTELIVAFAINDEVIKARKENEIMTEIEQKPPIGNGKYYVWT